MLPDLAFLLLQRIKDNLVPASDCAAEIIALGSDVEDWVVGDRVCINFHTAHLSGKFEPRIMYSGLGGQSDGVLTEYRNAPAEVRRIFWHGV